MLWCLNDRLDEPNARFSISTGIFSVRMGRNVDEYFVIFEQIYRLRARW